MMTEKPGSQQAKTFSSRDKNREESVNNSISDESNRQLYNLSALQKMAGDNEAFIGHAVKIFIEGSEDAIVDFKTDLREEKWKKIRDTAHKILPSFRHLEVNSVIPGLVEINHKILVERNTEGMPELVNQVISDIEGVLAEMRKDIR